jgi:hypothetical protein
MRSHAMDLEGNTLQLGRGERTGDHLFAPYGFTDDSWFHRTYWMFGDGFQGGVGGFGNAKRKPAGRILANNESTVFGYGRKPEYYRWGSAIDHQLSAAARPDSDSGPPQGVIFENSASLDPTSRPLTIAAWVKTDARDGTILVRGANQNGFALILSDRRPRMLLRTGGKTYDVVSQEPIGGDWTHVAGSLNTDGRMEVFVDGRPLGAIEGVPTLSGNPMIAMKLGYDDTNQLLPQPLTPFQGVMDEVLLFHRALSHEQIQRIAEDRSQEGVHDRDGLVLHLPFADGKLRDASSCANHGSFSGKAQAAVAGVVGDALGLRQPKQMLPAQAGKAKSSVAYRWTRDVPILVRAMAVAGDTLWIAGPADILDEVAAFQSYGDPETQAQLVAQDAALRGKSGASLLAVDAATGNTEAQYDLDGLPVFDGVIAANGYVLTATSDGRIIALVESSAGQ